MSVAHLKNCRQFYLSFSENEIGYTLCSQLSWSHLRLIMRLDTKDEKNYYISEAKQGNWSVRELERNIKTEMIKQGNGQYRLDCAITATQSKILNVYGLNPKTIVEKANYLSLELEKYGF